jgi:hypothetical protein
MRIKGLRSKFSVLCAKRESQVLRSILLLPQCNILLLVKVHLIFVTDYIQSAVFVCHEPKVHLFVGS